MLEADATTARMLAALKRAEQPLAEYVKRCDHPDGRGVNQMVPAIDALQAVRLAIWEPQIRRVLASTYTPEGVDVWLNAHRDDLTIKGSPLPLTPLYAIKYGLGKSVFLIARRIEGEENTDDHPVPSSSEESSA